MKTLSFGITVGITALCGCTIVATMPIAIAQSIAQPTRPEPQLQIVSPNAYKQPYLGFNGAFTVDTAVPASLNDPRNPKRIVVQQMEMFSFYSDLEGTQAIAENCPYIYMGAAPDPLYYAEYKSAVWDLFELTPGDEVAPACQQFKYIVASAPGGDPAHMHFRYGNADSSFGTVLNMSGDPKDEAQFNPWFSVYCAAGNSSCD